MAAPCSAQHSHENGAGTLLTIWLGEGVMLLCSASALASAWQATMSRMCFLIAAQKCGSGSTSNGCSI